MKRNGGYIGFRYDGVAIDARGEVIRRTLARMRELQAAGHDVRVVTLTDGEPPEGVEIRLRMPGGRVSVWPAESGVGSDCAEYWTWDRGELVPAGVRGVGVNKDTGYRS